MPPGSYRWSPLAENGAVELFDPVSERSALLRRPLAESLVMDDIVRIEELAFRESGGPPTAELFGALDTDPLRVLSGMNWLIAFWAVLWDLRSGEPAGDLARGLDYAGPWRKDATPEREQVWQAISRRVRDGVLAALTGDPKTRQFYEGEVRRLAPDIFLHVTLTIMDGLRNDLTGQGLELDGMAARLAEHTPAGTGGDPSFSPPR